MFSSLRKRFRGLKSRIRCKFEKILLRLLGRFQHSKFIEGCAIRYFGSTTTEEVEAARTCDFDFHAMVEKYVSGLSSDHKAELIDLVNSVTRKKSENDIARLALLRVDPVEQHVRYVNGDDITIISKQERASKARRLVGAS